MSSRLNASFKRWPGWVALLFAAIGLLTFGATRDSGPRTPDERIAAIERRLACPVCDGESVYESRNPASNQIRDRIRQDVEAGVLSDQEIIGRITSVYQGEELLVPTATGVEALAWALPAAAFVVAVASLVVAFRRWRAEAAEAGPVSDDDRQLVSAALVALDAASDCTDGGDSDGGDSDDRADGGNADDGDVDGS